MQIWRRRRRTTCEEADGKCEFNVAHEMVHNSLDGKVFRVRRTDQGGKGTEQCLRAARVATGRGRGSELLRGAL